MDDHEREVRRLRLAARSQQLEVESAEAELAMAQTSLTERLCEWAALGRRVRVDAVDRRRYGRLVHVGESVVTLSAEAGLRELIVLAHVEGVVIDEDPDVVGERIDWSNGHPRTLVAHLRSLVDAAGPVTIDRRSSDPITGSVIGVAPTHVSLRVGSGREALIPHDAVVSVTSSF